ncbi:hypothetical protein KR044_010237, partial [Drosophila immigrans]
VSLFYSTMWAPFVFLFLLQAEFSACTTRFTNIECVVLDESSNSFKKCELKVLGRGIVGMNLHVEVHNTTIAHVKQNISFWRKFSGFRPFMFNQTFDFCKLMANSNAKLSFEKIVLGSIMENSNINHSCPYTKDLIIKNLVFKEKFLTFLPMPSGEYKVQVMTAFNNIWVHRINVMMLHNEM